MPGFVDATGAATNGGWALGDASFERQLAGAARLAERPTAQERAAKQQQLNLL